MWRAVIVGCGCLVVSCAPAGVASDEGTETGEIPASPYTAPLVADLVVASELAAVRDLQARGAHLWLCAEQGGVRLFAVDSSPTVALQLPAELGNTCRAIDLNAGGDVMAISEGERVVLLGRLDGAWAVLATIDARATDVLWLPDDTLVLAQGEAGMSTWRASGNTWAQHADASEPNTPIEGLALTDGGIAAAAGRAGLRVYAVTDGAPSLSGNMPLDGYAVGVAVHEAAAYVATLDTVTSLDISNPAAPSIVGAASSNEVALGVAATAQHLAVADFKQVHVFDRTPVLGPVSHGVAIPGGETQVDEVDARSMAVTFDDEGRLWGATWSGAERFELKAEPAPHTVFARRYLDFDQVPAGGSKVVVLAAENRGDAPLQIDRVEFTSGRVSGPTGPWMVAPGEVEAIEIEFRSDGKSLDAEAWVVSDDPHEQLRRVTLRGNQPKLGVGDALPAFIEIDHRGELVTSAQLAGQVVMVSFFASWCSACNDEFPSYEQDLWRDLAQSGSGELAIVGLGRESAARIDGFAATHAVTFPLSVDEEIYERFEKPPGSVYALEYLFDRQGVLRYGGRGATAVELRPQLEALLEQ